MRVFLASVVAAILIAGAALFLMNQAQRPSGMAYTTEGARIAPSWSWRQVLRRKQDHAAAGQKVSTAGKVDASQMSLQQDNSARDACDQASALRWLFVDFTDTATADEGSECRS